jgi:mono/diheme cytochrome c family protein
MRVRILRLIQASAMTCLLFPTVTLAQADAAKIFKTNCSLCHSADGSGDSPTGKAMHAKDLRSDEIQKQSDAALIEVMTRVEGKSRRLERRSRRAM